MISCNRTLALVPWLLAACGGEPPREAPLLPVTVAPVTPEGGTTATRYGGVIAADVSVDLAFRVSGIVEEVAGVRGADGRLRPLQDGDPVRRGATLARLRPDEFRDQLTDAEASLRQAEADYERAAQLYENRSVSRADYDAAYARYTAAGARRSQAAIALRDATLRAPIDGVILRRTVEAGSLGGPAGPAFTLADTRIVKVVFGVPDVLVGDLTPGGRLDIQAEALPGELLEGRITRIAPSADPNSRVFEVEAALPNPGQRLRVGMLATLALGEPPAAGALYVPLAAVVRPGPAATGYAVYVVTDSGTAGVARLRPVTLGDPAGNLVAVRSGVAAGERVIVRGATIVTDGQAVRIIP